jgi:AAA family ATP:ADP antiporter
VHGWTPVEEGVRELLKHAEKDSELARPMIARAIRYHPLPAFVPVLRRLAADPDLETRRQAILAMRATGAIELVPNLIAALAERALREDARDALVALGVPALATLEVALGDASMPAAIRIHLPRTVARFQSQRAAEMLVRHLVSEPRGTMRYRALRGLGRMVANDPSLKLDEKALDGILESMVMTLFQRLHWQMTLEAGAVENPSRRTPGHELLMQLLRDKETLAIERLFRVLGLRYRGEQWADVYEGIDSDDPVARSSGRELLESVLPREIGRAVAALTAEAPAENRLGEAGDFYRPVSVSYEELIELLAGEHGETLRLVARYHAVEIGLRADTEGFMRPAEDEPGWIEPLRDLANKMARDLPRRTSEATGDA